MRLKKRFWIAILTAVLLLNLLPGMTPEAAAADDTQSLGTFNWVCTGCKNRQDLEILAYLSAPSVGNQETGYHWIRVRCPSCEKEDRFTGDDNTYFKHTGGNETPTCTTGKTCEKCGAEYGILGHDWGEWQSSGNGTHSRTCKREGCGAVDTANCGGDGSATCVTPGTCTACGGQYYSGHTFPKTWNWRSDSDVGRDAKYHWVRCLYCTEGKINYKEHLFVQGTDDSCLESPATCVSN